MDPATTQAIIDALAKGASILGGSDDSGEESAKINQETRREELFYKLVEDELLRQRENRSLDATVPLRQALIQTILDPTRVAGGRGLLGASSTPRTYKAADEEGNVIPGAASLQRPSLRQPEQGARGDIFGRPAGPTTQYGQEASPDQLMSLVPDFSRFAAMQNRAAGLTAGITPDAFKRGSTLGAVNSVPGLSHIIAPGRGSGEQQQSWYQQSQPAINNIVNPGSAPAPAPTTGVGFAPLPKKRNPFLMGQR